MDLEKKRGLKIMLETIALKKLTLRDARIIKCCISENRSFSATKIAEELRKYGNKLVHKETIRRVINDARFTSRSPRQEPYISLINRKKRIEYARKYLHAPDFFMQVNFFDESKYIFGINRRIRVRRRSGDEPNPKYTAETVKHGNGDVEVWGCMSASGIENFDLLRLLWTHLNS